MHQEMAFKLLTTNWSGLSNADKIALFEGTKHEQATISELQSLGKFKILKYSDINTQGLNTVQIDGVPQDQLVLPVSLFGQSFGAIKSITIDELITDTANAQIRYVVTQDLATYFTCVNGVWSALNNVTASDVLSQGMTSADLARISPYAWSKFYTNTSSGIGIGFAFHETATSQSTAIDGLHSTVDLRGSWSVASLGTDFTIKYTSNSTMQVSLLVDGDFKINYQNAM